MPIAVGDAVQRLVESRSAKGTAPPLSESVPDMTLDQIKTASPARGYTRRYGTDSGPWTTNNFVEAVYQTLAPGKP